MKQKLNLILVLLCMPTAVVTAQVQVSKEPRHKNVLENKYIRLLDVQIRPGDTSLFHIHSTPSVFVHFTTTTVCVQIQGKEWEKSKNTQGNASYKSFVIDTLVHRVSNCDTVPFHVIAVELLSPYNPAKHRQSLPFPVLFENERVTGYRLTTEFNNQVIKGRGPMIAEMVAGSEILIHNKKGKVLSKLIPGNYLYIKPGSSFYFSETGDAAINMVLFEIK